MIKKTILSVLISTAAVSCAQASEFETGAGAGAGCGRPFSDVQPRGLILIPFEQQVELVAAPRKPVRQSSLELRFVDGKDVLPECFSKDASAYRVEADQGSAEAQYKTRVYLLVGHRC